jgi:hypothetical protein
MKSEIKIVFETKDMNPLYENEDGTGERVEDNAERELHSAVVQELISVLGDHLKNSDSEVITEIEENVLNDYDCSIEGYDSLTDYAKEVRFTVEKVK